MERIRAEEVVYTQDELEFNYHKAQLIEILQELADRGNCNWVKGTLEQCRALTWEEFKDIDQDKMNDYCCIKTQED